jgi:hypothetical protein
LQLPICRPGTLAAVEQFGSGLGEQRDTVGLSVANHRAKKRRQNLFTRFRNACNSLRYPWVPGKHLMATFVGDHFAGLYVLHGCAGRDVPQQSESPAIALA